MEDRLYYSQYRVKGRIKIRSGELQFIRFLLYNDSNPSYPKKAIVKIFDSAPEYIQESEVMIILSRLDSSIIKWYYTIIASSKLYIFMEPCVKKLTLFDTINKMRTKGKEFNHGFLEDQLIKLKKGLSKIHNKGYIHCDIATKNIFISDNNQFKIGDFGSVVKKNCFIKEYSREYIKPELLERINKGHFSTAKEENDYWALGKVFFECILLENQINFSFQNSLEILKHIDEILRINRIPPSLGREIKNLITYNNSLNNSQIQTLQNLSLKSSITSYESHTLCSFCLGPENCILFKCKHAVHKSCFFEKIGGKESTINLCPLCGKFIGNQALKELHK